MGKKLQRWSKKVLLLLLFLFYITRELSGMESFLPMFKDNVIRQRKKYTNFCYTIYATKKCVNVSVNKQIYNKFSILYKYEVLF